MGRFDGKTVFITGGARGQGRAHALGFAREGANIVAIDIADPDDAVPSRGHTLASADDLAETAKQVEALDRRCLAIKADVRDRPAMNAAVEQAVSEFGGIDVLIAQAAICTLGPLVEQQDEDWDASIGTILTGTWNTLKPAVPHMLERGLGGRIIITITAVTRNPAPNALPYIAAKFGLIGIVKSLSQELMQHGITVNGVNPNIVNTGMAMFEQFFKLFRPDLEHPTLEDVEPVFLTLSDNGEPYLEPEDITDGMLYLASHEARKVSGIMLDVMAGGNARQAG